MSKWETVWTHCGIDIMFCEEPQSPRDYGYKVDHANVRQQRYNTVGDAAAAIERIVTA